MSLVKILIVEDEPIIAADLAFTLSNMGYEVFDPVGSGEEALGFLENEQPDLILMDIQLEGNLDGIDTAHRINATQPIPIIFLTSNTDQRTFGRARLTQPHAFLSKPFRAPDLQHSIELALVQASNDKGALAPVPHLDRLFVKSKDRLVKVLFDEIRWVEADRYYSWIVTADRKHLVTLSLKKLSEQLPVERFVRASRSHLVNIGQVDEMDDHYLFINGEKILIGKSYKEELMNRFLKL